LPLLSEHDLIQLPQRSLQVRVERFQLDNPRERRLQAFGRFWFHAVNLTQLPQRFDKIRRAAICSGFFST
jgi:hypothetical protein